MPLENVEFEDPKEFKKPNALSAQKLYGAEQNKDIYSSMPLDVQLAMFPDQPYLNKFEHPKLNQEPQESPGFFSSAAHAFSENNEFFEAGRSVSNLVDHINHFQDDVPEGWTPFETSNLDGIDKKYWGYVFDAVSPKELQARREFIFSKQDEDEKYNNGSTLGSFIGGAGGILFSPTTALFPISSTIKYAKASQNIIQNLIKLAPEIATQAIAHNAFMEGNKVGGNLEEFAVNSIRDTVAGLALTGGALAYGSVVTGGKLFAARKMLNLNREGFEVKHVVNEKGEIIGRKAVPGEGNNVSAAEISYAQDFLDSSMAIEGLFKVPGVSKVAEFVSPLVRMLNSEFTVVSEFANRLTDHSIITKGLAAGRATKNSFERVLWGIQGQTKQIIWQLEGYRNEANGIINGGSPEFVRKALSQHMEKAEYLNKEQFGDAVASVIRTGESHSNKSINAAANALSQHLEKSYSRFLKAHDLSEEILDPRTAIGYLMRNYNRDAVMEPTKDWSGVISGHLKEQDELISNLNAPIEAQEALIKELESVILKPNELNSTSAKAHSDLLESSKNELSRLKNNLNNQLRDNPDYHILLEKRNLMSSKDVEQLKAILKPLKVQEEKISSVKKDLTVLKEQKSKAKASALKSKTEETRAKHNESFAELQARVDELETQLHEMELDKFKIDADMNGRAMDGLINPRLFFKDPDTGQIHFRDPNDSPKFRKVYEDDNERLIAANAYRETILNVSPEQIGQQILHQLSGGSLENPLKTRSIMIPDTVLQNAGFLSNDLQKSVSIYDSILGKKTAFKEAFGGFGHEDGLKGVIDQLTSQRRQKEFDLKSIPGEAGDIANKKMNEAFNRGIKDITKAYNHAMGINSSSYNARQYSRAARALVMATRLGAMPISMITDIGGVILNNNFIRVLRDGILPCLETFNGFASSKNGEAYRESFSHLSIATEHQSHAYTERIWNSSTMQDVNGAGKLVNGLEGLAHLSGNLSGANSLDNWMQGMAANITQSKVMRYMFKHADGTITDKERLILNRFGIPPEEWGPRFIEAYKKHGGESNGHGGHYSYYYQWADAHASVKMGEAIRSGVRESVLKKGLLDAPFWTNDPGWGMLTYLKGFAFSSFNRFTIPSMQRMDADKAIGLGVMLLMGSLVDPLRKWTRGESYDFDDKTKFAIDTITNSGALGIISDVLQEANALMPDTFGGKLKSDRYRERSIAGVLGGPLGGIGNDIANILNSFGSGKINQKDMQKFVRLIPLTQLWYLRYLSNKLVESMNLPKNTNHAESWFN